MNPVAPVTSARVAIVPGYPRIALGPPSTFMGKPLTRSDNHCWGNL
jgi:hypothetical protein